MKDLILVRQYSSKWWDVLDPAKQPNRDKRYLVINDLLFHVKEVDKDYQRLGHGQYLIVLKVIRLLYKV